MTVVFQVRRMRVNVFVTHYSEASAVLKTVWSLPALLQGDLQTIWVVLLDSPRQWLNTANYPSKSRPLQPPVSLHTTSICPHQQWRGVMVSQLRRVIFKRSKVWLLDQPTLEPRAERDPRASCSADTRSGCHGRRACQLRGRPCWMLPARHACIWLIGALLMKPTKRVRSIERGRMPLLVVEKTPLTLLLCRPPSCLRARYITHDSWMGVAKQLLYFVKY